jgi:hypothetical protein
MTWSRRTLVVLICCCLSPLPFLAQASGAMLYATGQVTVNGRAVANSSAILAGDRIEVGPSSSATMAAPGMSAQIGAQSAVTWRQQALEFQNGSMTVSAKMPWQVQIGSTSVSLGPEMSKVEVIQREDVALVKLVQGSGSVNEAGQTTALKIGFTVARPHPAVVAQAGSSVPPATATHASHVGIIAAVAGGAAAAGIGLGLRGHGSTQTQTPVSPSVP